MVLQTISSADSAPSSGAALPWPKAPRTIAETGLPEEFLEELALKTVHYGGPASIEQLMRRMGLGAAVVEEVVDRLRAGGALEASSSHSVDSEQGQAAVRNRLSGRGEQRVADALARCRYAGVAPVTLAGYEPLARSQSLRVRPPAVAQIGRALAPFVLAAEVRLALGRAFHSGRPTLVYGASGNGKTALINALARSCEDTVLIPAALMVHGQLIRIFDASLHRRAGIAPSDPEAVDGRWLPVRRPVVKVAAELAPQSLDLEFDEEGGVYVAPVQLKAQDGLLLVDDFGRQQVAPEDLLGRWIEPLERGSDRLTLQSGEQFSLAFEVSLLLATNQAPSSLAGEAFLRHIPYKVHVAAPGPAELAEITRRECSRRALACDEAGVAAVVAALCQANRPGPRGVSPQDLLSIIEDGARFAGTAAAVTAASVDEACRVYFVAEGA